MAVWACVRKACSEVGARRVGGADAGSVGVVGFLGDKNAAAAQRWQGVFLLATGVGALRAHALPRWLAQVTMGLGVLCLLGPAALSSG